ncbi:MAG: diguanylate cyclase, partial [Rhodobacteraceae bacterium]|nr:diguanylate cyclase [Paracoccaceae bacterium]
AVFQPSGDLVVSNAAFARLWNFDPGETLGRVTVMDAVRVWQEQCEASPLWANVRDYATRIGQRPPLGARVRLRNGRAVSCRFVSLNGGATLA